MLIEKWQSEGFLTKHHDAYLKKDVHELVDDTMQQKFVIVRPNRFYH